MDEKRPATEKLYRVLPNVQKLAYGYFSSKLSSYKIHSTKQEEGKKV